MNVYMLRTDLKPLARFKAGQALVPVPHVLREPALVC